MLLAREIALFLCLANLWGLAKRWDAFRLQLSDFAKRLAKQRKMKIAKVESILVSCPLPEPLVLPFYGGVRTVLKRDAMFIRVTADNGLVGYAPGPAHERAERELADWLRENSDDE